MKRKENKSGTPLLIARNTDGSIAAYKTQAALSLRHDSLFFGAGMSMSGTSS